MLNKDRILLFKESLREIFKNKMCIKEKINPKIYSSKIYIKKKLLKNCNNNIMFLKTKENYYRKKIRKITLCYN